MKKSTISMIVILNLVACQGLSNSDAPKPSNTEPSATKPNTTELDPVKAVAKKFADATKKCDRDTMLALSHFTNEAKKAKALAGFSANCSLIHEVQFGKVRYNKDESSAIVESLVIYKNEKVKMSNVRAIKTANGWKMAM